MKKIILLLVAIILCSAIYTIYDHENGIASYVGNTYTGSTPWGENLSITVNRYKNSSVEITIHETVLSEYKFKRRAEGNIFNDNTIVINNDTTSAQESHDIKYNYTRKVRFIDNQLIVTYIDGEAVDTASDGVIKSRKVGELSEKKKTVILKCSHCVK